MHVLPKSGRRGIGLKEKSKVSVRVRTEGTEASVIAASQEIGEFKWSRSELPPKQPCENVRKLQILIQLSQRDDQKTQRLKSTSVKWVVPKLSMRKEHKDIGGPLRNTE